MFDLEVLSLIVGSLLLFMMDCFVCLFMRLLDFVLDDFCNSGLHIRHSDFIHTINCAMCVIRSCVFYFVGWIGLVYGGWVVRGWICVLFSLASFGC